MSDFDPYHKWLGVSPQHQPPHHYRLLSLDLCESDPDVIEASVDRIVAFLQDVAAGPHAKESQKLLNEVAAARLCLLDATQKRAYDEKLRVELADAIQPPRSESEPPPPPVAPAIVIHAGASSVVQRPPAHKPSTKRTAVKATSKRAASSATGKTPKRGKQPPSPLLLLSFISGGSLLIFAIVFALFAGGSREAKRRAAEEGRVRERLDSFAKMGRDAESMIPDFQPQFEHSPPPSGNESK